ncbi:MAG: DegV family protein, partial [Lachnospiraceae bacterium]|nr:DegV family protein [Lachnospiraceae bacterium]
MGNYNLTCCSTADLSKKYFEERDIKVVFFHFSLNGVEYPDDMGESVPPKELFNRMNSGEETKTSQVTVGEYIDFFEPMLKEGKDILHVTLSSGISGTLNSAQIAQKQLLGMYPERKIYVVDSLGASSGYGLLMDALADKRDEGMGIDDLNRWAIDNRLRLNHWFYSTDLTFYIRGGRVNKVAGAVGNVLGICPLLNVDFEGKLIPREKIRGKKKVMKRNLEMMIE